jgi:hypothetical protein
MFNVKPCNVRITVKTEVAVTILGAFDYKLTTRGVFDFIIWDDIEGIAMRASFFMITWEFINFSVLVICIVLSG